MNIFGVGPAEAGLVFVIALIVVGPQRFPEIMRTAGRWYRMARAYSNEVMKDVRSAVDDIEREVKAETDDLKSVGELANIGQDLRRAREDVDEVGRDTRSVLRDEPKPVRPSQRGAQSSEDDPAPAPNSNGNAAEVAEASEQGEAVASKRPAPAVPPIERRASEAAEAAEGGKAAEKPAETFDPFKREKPRKGPVLIPRESPSNEGDERSS